MILLTFLEQPLLTDYILRYCQKNDYMGYKTSLHGL